MSTKAQLTRLQKRLDLLSIEQLRNEVTRLHEELERTQIELSHAQDNADFWHDQAHTLTQAFDDEDFSTHRSIGINKSGELLVVQTTNA